MAEKNINEELVAIMKELVQEMRFTREVEQDKVIYRLKEKYFMDPDNENADVHILESIPKKYWNYEDFKNEVMDLCIARFTELNASILNLTENLTKITDMIDLEEKEHDDDMAQWNKDREEYNVGRRKPLDEHDYGMKVKAAPESPYHKHMVNTVGFYSYSSSPYHQQSNITDRLSQFNWKKMVLVDIINEAFPNDSILLLKLQGLI